MSEISELSDSALVAAVRGCKRCEAELPCEPRPIFQFSSEARILVAGQAPGQKAHDADKPFSDPSGKRLRAWMGVNDEVFYDAEQVAILPMGFCYPGRGKSGDLPPLKACEMQWRETLLQRMPRLSLVLVIGQYAMSYHLPDFSSVTAAVESWQRYAPAVFPLPHPSPRNQYWLKRHPWFEAEVIPALQQQIAAILCENG